MGRPATAWRSSSSYYRNIGTYHNRSNGASGPSSTGPTGADILNEMGDAGVDLFIIAIPLAVAGCICLANWVCGKMREDKRR